MNIKIEANLQKLDYHDCLIASNIGEKIMAIILEQQHLLRNDEYLTIRSASVSDAKGIKQCSLSVLAEEIYTVLQVEELEAKSVEDGEERIRKHIESPNFLMLVAEVQGKIVGSIDFSNGHCKRIQHTGDFGVVILEGYRNLGIGKLLVKSLIEWAKENKTIEKIQLKAHADNVRAIALYEKLGFVKEGLIKKEIKYANGRYVDTVCMGLGLV